MSAYTISCPHCQAALRSAKPVPPGKPVRCPKCGGSFTTAEPDSPFALDLPECASTRPNTSPALKTGLLAFGLVGGLVLVLAAGAGVALVVTREAPRDTAEARRLAETEKRAADAERRAAEDRAAWQKRLDEQREAAEQDRRRLEKRVSEVEADARARQDRPALPPPPPAAVDPKPAEDLTAKRNKAEYEAHMDAGRAAMVDQRYKDALREFRVARELMPGDAAAIRGERDAQDRMGERKDQDRRRAAFAAALDRARTALQARRYDEAVSAANEALQMIPDDAEGQKLQRQALQAKRNAKAAYDQAMAAGDAAMASGQYGEASSAYAQALQYSPDDAAALERKRAADQGASVGNTQLNLFAYYRYMAAGALAMQNGAYGAATRNYAAAAQLMPGDLAAAGGLAEAQAALAGRQIVRANLYQLIQTGYTALQNQRRTDAINAFQSALAIDSDNKLALAGLKQAQALKK